jgi:hypothetical protein
VKVPVEKLEKRDVQVLLAKSFEMGGKIDPTGWWMSEKCTYTLLVHSAPGQHSPGDETMEGGRGLVLMWILMLFPPQWMESEHTGMERDTFGLVSVTPSTPHRGSQLVRPPPQNLPPLTSCSIELPRGHTLDGELFHSRNSFDVASSIVRSHDAGDRWGELKYQVRLSLLFPRSN